jgi:hypothetical protein
MMDNDKHLDDELAEYTDKILKGGAMNISSENEDLAPVVRQLQSLFAKEEAPPVEFRQRLDARLGEEWNRTMRPAQIHRLEQQRFLRRTMFAAASIALVFIVFLFLGDNNTPNGSDTQGTAFGDSPWMILAFVSAIIGIVFAVSYIRSRRS